MCSGWHRGIAAGVERLELDMNPCAGAFAAKVERLRRLTPSLSACKAHVSAAVPQPDLAANLAQLGSKMQNIQVRRRPAGRPRQQAMAARGRIARRATA